MPLSPIKPTEEPTVEPPRQLRMPLDPMLTLAVAYYYMDKRELAAAIVGVAQSVDQNSAEAYVVEIFARQLRV